MAGNPKVIDNDYGDMVFEYFSIGKSKDTIDKAYECTVSDVVRTRNSIKGVSNNYKCQVSIEKGKIVSSKCECKWSTMRRERCKHCCALCLQFI